MRNFYLSERSTVYSTNCAVATSHPLSTSTAINIIKQGGNAIDAAISASAVLSVVEPTEAGLGGDCVALVAPKGETPPVAFNGCGFSPLRGKLEWFIENDYKEIPSDSPHSVTIPGALDAWIKLHEKFGKLDFEELLQPAINYAENGFVIHDRVYQSWEFAYKRLENDLIAKKIFLPNGKIPKIGDKFFNIPLANTFKKICKNGWSEFYCGETSEKIVKYLNQLGGFHTLEDFSSYKGNFVNPISANYRDKKIYQMPPNTQGIIALIMLKILEKYNLSQYEIFNKTRIHLFIEAAKISYLIRDQYLGSDMNSDEIIDFINNPSFINNFLNKIDLNKTSEINSILPLSNSNTVYLTIVDKDQNCVSIINSIYESFGSGICPPDTGILLQNRGKSFKINKMHPNCLGPRKRPMTTIMPGMVSKDNLINLSFGVMGGDYQPVGHAHIISALYDNKMDLQKACDLPRFFWNSNTVFVEESFDINLFNQLEKLGHIVKYNDEPLGGAQLISIDWKKGILAAASDSRKDGCALGF